MDCYKWACVCSVMCVEEKIGEKECVKECVHVYAWVGTRRVVICKTKRKFLDVSE